MPWLRMAWTMSVSTPAAVTSAPAPGPRTIRGCALYRADENTSILSLPASCAKGCDLGYLGGASARNSSATAWLSACRRSWVARLWEGHGART